MLRQAMSIFMVVCFLMSSCQKTERASSLKRKELRLSISEEPLTLDPRKGGDAISSHLHFMLYEGLTRLNEDGSTTPAQCYQIDVSEDKLTYTFHMGKTRWSNGSTVTSYDFEKAWKDILSPSFPSPNAHLLYPIKGAEAAKKGKISLSEVGIHAPNPNTFIVELAAPTPYFLQMISFCVFFPVNKALDEENPAWAFNAHKNFICNGPFCLSEWKHHNEIIVKKNPLFRVPEEVQLESIRLSIIANEMTSLQMYENGELDFVGHPFSTLPTDAVKSLHQKRELKITPAAATTFIAFNTEKSWFQNENLRKAFAYAMNRQEIVENITQLDETVATEAVPPILKNNRTTVFYTDNKQDLAKAYLKEAISELGISKKDLGQLTFLYSNLDNHHKVAQVLQQQWLQTLGVHVQLQAMEHKTLLDRLSKRDYSFGLTIWRAQYHDPINILERFKLKENTKNYPGWENEEFKQLLNRSALEAAEDRMATLERAEQIFLEELPVAPLYHWSFCYLNRPYLKDIHFSPVGGIFFERLSLHDTAEIR